jgi:3-hydroxyisobutyrate dehydrogenase
LYKNIFYIDLSLISYFYMVKLLRNSRSMEHVAVIGTGKMGSAFVKRFLDVGYKVTAWNRTFEKAMQLQKDGAEVVREINEIKTAETYILSLTDATAVENVTDEIIKSNVSNKLIIDTSTLLPEDTKRIANKLKEEGLRFVDCPVGGTVAPALNGKLLGMLGGAKQDASSAMPILQQICRRVEHMGEVGSGSHMKLAINLPLAIYWKTLAEALIMVRESGIEIAQAISVIADSSGGPTVLKNREDVVVKTLSGDDQISTVSIEVLFKDLQLAITQSQKTNSPMTISVAALDAYADAIKNNLGKFDGSTLTRFLVDE